MIRHPISQRFTPSYLTEDYDAARHVVAAPQPVENPALVSPLNPYGTREVQRVIAAIQRREREGAAQDDPDTEAPPRGYVVACVCGCGVKFRSFWGQRYASDTCRRRLNHRIERERKRAKALAAPPSALLPLQWCACGCGATFRPVTTRNGRGKKFFDAVHARRANNRIEQERRRAGQARAFGGAA
jgi:hypothetical protein